MNQDPPEIDWLIEQRPDPPAPSRASTEDARAALLAHGARQHRRRRNNNRRRSGGLALTGVVAAGAVTAAVVGQHGHSTRHRSHTTIAIAPQTAADPGGARAAHRTPLVRLAADVRLLPATRQPGDATLVVRYTVLDGHHSIGAAVWGGYDLYTDSGHYYYAPHSLAELQQIEASGQAVNDPGNEARALRTIAAAAAGTPAQARAAILSTEPHDGRPPTLSAAQKRKLRTLPARHRRAGERLLALDSNPDVRAHKDSLVWLDATQALAVGAGRPDVRATCIKALDTLEAVRETSTRVNDVDALRVSFPDGPVPVTVWLDASTGVPIQERDGRDSTTTYAVERVDAAHLPARISIRAHLR